MVGPDPEPVTFRVPRPRLVDAVLFGGAVTWGSTYLLTKVLLSDTSNIPVVVASRMLLSAAVLFPFARVTRRGCPTRAELGCGLVLGLSLSAVFAFETYGIALTSATNAGVLISLCLVLVPFAEAALRRTRPRPALVLLALAAVVGAGMLADGDGFTEPRPGDLLILGAALARVVHVTTSSHVQGRQPLDPYRLTAVQLATVGAIFAALCPVVDAPVGTFLTTLTLPDIAALLCLAVVAGAIGFGIQTWGIAKTSAAHASLLLGTEPVWAALFGVVLAGDHLGPVGVTGIVVTLIAVLAGQRVTGTPTQSSPQSTLAALPGGPIVAPPAGTRPAGA